MVPQGALYLRVRPGASDNISTERQLARGVYSSTMAVPLAADAVKDAPDSDDQETN
jgi:hypothetical protein